MWNILRYCRIRCLRDQCVRSRFDMVLTPLVDRTMNTSASYAGDAAASTPDRSLNTETVLGSVVVVRPLAIRPTPFEQKGITVMVSGITSGDTTNSSIPTRVR